MRRSAHRSAILLAVIAATTLLGGCAVTTGRYVADRAPVNSHSMTSRFDRALNSHYSEDVPGLSSGTALHMPQARRSGLFYFRY